MQDALSSPQTTPTPSKVVEGDTNGDGTFNSLDFGTLRQILLGMNVNKYAFWEVASDLNKDGEPNSLDFGLMRKRLLGQN
jgi:hypothetical protein